MSKKASPVPNAVKAAFREEARRIIREDRAARLSGASQNTIGAVTSALERAFKLGRDNPEDVGAPDRSWEVIAPRARDALIDLGMRARPVHGLAATHPILVGVETLGRVRWKIEGSADQARTYSSGAINPLLKLRLLEPVAARPTALHLSSAGYAAFDLYWRRRLAHDPTLPLEGMRPTKLGY